MTNYEHNAQREALHSAPILNLLPAGSGVPPRYQHIASKLQEWGLPNDLVQLGLVLRALERGTIRPAQLARLLGPEAVAAAETLALLSGSPERPALRAVEPSWKLFMLAYLHPSASVLKITETLMHLHHSQAADVNVSAATITAASHVCGRLGMWEVRADLLDAQARLADPHLVRRARELLDHSQSNRIRFFTAIEQRLNELFHAQGIRASIERRPRRIHRVVEDGLERARGTFPWADVVIVLIDNIQDCYRALGAINSSFPVVGSRLRDYIGGSKENGYQALHTTVEFSIDAGDERSAPVDIRIMTPAMDHCNRYGYLAYLAGVVAPARRPWWADRERWLAAYSGHSKESFVFTPKGEAILLPRGATVLDFAVRIHSNLGVYCRGALVNGYRAAPGAILEPGDICEVLIDQQGAPIDARLLDMVRTKAARATIRRALQKDTTGVAHGRQIFRAVLERRLAAQKIHSSETMIDQQVAAICRARNYASVDAFYRAVARGEAAPDQIVRTIVGELLLPRLDLNAVPAPLRSQARHIRLALCCHPHPDLPAVAVAVHNGYEIKIHSATCAKINAPAYPITWKPVEQQAYVGEVHYEGWDRPGLVHELTSALHEVGAINIRSFHADVPEPSLARIHFSFETPDAAKIEQLRQALEAIPDRRHIEMRQVMLIDEGVRIMAPLDNPYSPQPVGRWPLFVGRNSEVSRVLAQLEGHSGASHMLIRGPKRIGKSSLLQHLSRYHLLNFNVPALLDLQSLPTEELRFPRLLQRIAGLIVQKAGPRSKARVPELAALEHDPIGSFAIFLADTRSHHDTDRFVILIDEFGVILSRLRNSQGANEFFDQWRALLNTEAIYQHLAFIVALPDTTLLQMRAQGGEPSMLRIGELGHSIRLSVLDADDARDLITAPIRNHLVYHPADLDLLLHETGAHPYYIHLVCGQIVTAIQVQQRKTGLNLHERQFIPSSLVRSALDSIARHDDAFHHTLADTSPETGSVLRSIAALTREDEPFVARARLRTRLKRNAVPAPDAAIDMALTERPDLFVETDQQIAIRVALVARWVRRSI